MQMLRCLTLNSLIFPSMLHLIVHLLRCYVLIALLTLVRLCVDGNHHSSYWVNNRVSESFLSSLRSVLRSHVNVGPEIRGVVCFVFVDAPRSEGGNTDEEG